MNDRRPAGSLPQHTGTYRSIWSFDDPYVPTPRRDWASNNLPMENNEDSCDQQPVVTGVSGSVPTRRKPFRTLIRKIRRLIPGQNSPAVHTSAQSANKDNEKSTSRPFPNDWKAFGHWARPVVNGVQVNNLAPRELYHDYSADPEQLFMSLVGPDGSPHPSLWPPGYEHPALPPKPPHWLPPAPTQPQLPPWQCELNPFLQHTPTTRPPLNFDIIRMPEEITLGQTHVWVNMTTEERAQPATWPFLTRMVIRTLADDITHANPLSSGYESFDVNAPEPEIGSFPWPMLIYEPDGILCDHILTTIYQNFQQLVSQREFGALGEKRRQQVLDAYRRRLGTENLQPKEPLRRIDCMGDRTMFRGLEPSPDKDGTWIMYLGPP